jgi:hypothetical protein
VILKKVVLNLGFITITFIKSYPWTIIYIAAKISHDLFFCVLLFHDGIMTLVLKWLSRNAHGSLNFKHKNLIPIMKERGITEFTVPSVS